MNITMRHKIIFTIAGVITVFGILSLLVIVPSFMEIRQIISAIHREQAELELRYQQGQRTKKIIAEYRKIEPRRDLLNRIFIPSGDELEFITTLERLQKEYRVEITPTVDASANDLGPDAPLPLSITVRGNYIETLRYLIAVERLSYYFNIGTIGINPTDPDRGNVVLTLNGKVYRKPYQVKSAGTSLTETPTPTDTPAAGTAPAPLTNP